MRVICIDFLHVRRMLKVWQYILINTNSINVIYNSFRTQILATTFFIFTCVVSEVMLTCKSRSLAAEVACAR